MNATSVIYDALAMPVVDPAMIGVSLFIVMGSALVAVRAWRKPAPHLARGSVKGMQSRDMPKVMAISGLSFLVFAGVETVLWRWDYTHHRYTVLDGCVTGFEEALQRGGELGVDDFTLQGESFRVSDSDWRLGYHRSFHNGSPIEEGSHLRAFAHGRTLLRIERERAPCTR